MLVRLTYEGGIMHITISLDTSNDAFVSGGLSEIRSVLEGAVALICAGDELRPIDLPLADYSGDIIGNIKVSDPAPKAAYTLVLTQDDIDSIHFVGKRYCWSDALWSHCRDLDDDETELVIGLQEHEAWALNDAFKSDTKGGHQMFPMLDTGSDLADKLTKFVDSIV